MIIVAEIILCIFLLFELLLMIILISKWDKEYEVKAKQKKEKDVRANMKHPESCNPLNAECCDIHCTCYYKNYHTHE